MRDVNGYEGHYQIDEYGNVYGVERYNFHIKGYRKVTPRKLRQHKTRKGYLNVYLYKGSVKKTCAVHRLVAQAWVDNPKKLPQVNHIDGNKMNNYHENLQWSTNLENMRHSFYVLGRRMAKGSRNHRSRLVIDLRTGIFYDTIGEAAVARNVKYSTLMGHLKRGKNDISFC